jgi:Subtilase family/PatG C-terminal
MTMLKSTSIQQAIRLDALMQRTEGNPAIKIGVIDGAADLDHPALDRAKITVLGRPNFGGCQSIDSEACIHGTFVLGLLAANRNSRSPGICPGCTFLLRPIFCEERRVTDCPAVTTDDLADQVMQVIRAGARIINLSIGSVSLDANVSPRLLQAYAFAKQKEVLIIGASGNQGGRMINPTLRHPWIVPVAATDLAGELHTESNLKSDATLRVPGIDVTGLQAGNGFRQMTGTSIAAPFVTGAAALLWSLMPDATAQVIREALFAVPENRSGLFDALAAWRQLKSQNNRQLLYRMKNHDFNFRDRADALVLQNSEEIDPGAVAQIAQEADTEEAAKREASDSMQIPSCSCAKNSRQNGSPTGAVPQSCSCSSTVPVSFVYAIGTVRPTFPNEGLRKEYDFAASQLKVQPTDYYSVLSNPSYFYIAQETCWILEISSIDSFIIHPRSVVELRDLIEAIKPIQNSTEKPMSIIIGGMYLNKPYPRCPHVQLPVVVVNQVFYFDFQTLIQNLTAKNIEVESVKSVLEALELKPNPGISDFDRALNYIAFRFPEMYKKADELKNPPQAPGYFILGVTTKPASVQGNRRVVDVIFQYQQYDTGEQQFYYCAIDVTGQFPFLQSPLRLFVPAN